MGGDVRYEFAAERDSSRAHIYEGPSQRHPPKWVFSAKGGGGGGCAVKNEGGATLSPLCACKR